MPEDRTSDGTRAAKGPKPPLVTRQGGSQQTGFRHRPPQQIFSQSHAPEQQIFSQNLAPQQQIFSYGIPAAADVRHQQTQLVPPCTRPRFGLLVASAGEANLTGLVVSSRTKLDHSSSDPALHHQTGLVPFTETT